ncbi:MAG: transglycosylase SLT domain-containing protein [bacterium]|nr:transglycosylase SLT domain-containing protein [bacterium]
MLIVCLARACTAWAGDLALDSARAARFWSYWESGDTVAARAALDDTESPASTQWDDRANFLTAYIAFADSDFAVVPTLLDLGVPPELAPHAAWLRASALRSLGQPHLAAIYWRELLTSPLPDYRDTGVRELFVDALGLGKLDTLESLSRAAKQYDVDRSLRQEIDLAAADLLTRSGRHAEAVPRLRRVYLLSPGTKFGKQAQAQLDDYAVRHGYAAPALTWDDEWEEVQRLEQSGQRSQAIDKVEALRQRGRYAAHDELLLARQVRLAIALRRHYDAQRLAQQHLKQFPNSSYRDEMWFSLVRAAYLTDQDTLALNTAGRLARSGTDNKYVADAWRLIGLLHIDRGRPAEAADAFDKWVEAADGGDGADDALWNRGWARYQANQFGAAARDFVRLVETYPKGGYVPIGLYWSAQAFRQNGQPELADSLCTALRERLPYSYYAQLDCSDLPAPAPVPNNFVPLSLDQLAAVGSTHTRAFTELTALGLWELALREWPQVEAECGQRADVAWWRPLLYWFAGQRFEAWRWIVRELREEASSAGSRPADFFRLWYPLDYEPLLLDLCAQYRVDPYLALGVICQESHFDEDIVSPAGAIGLMQLMPATAREQAKRIGQTVRDEDLYHGPRNLEIGVAHLADLMRDLDGDTVLTLCAYNAGINAAQRWQREFGQLPRDMFVERIPYKETRLYVKYILQHMAAYRRLYPHLAPVLPVMEP